MVTLYTVTPLVAESPKGGYTINIQKSSKQKLKDSRNQGIVLSTLKYNAENLLKVRAIPKELQERVHFFLYLLKDLQLKVQVCSEMQAYVKVLDFARAAMPTQNPVLYIGIVLRPKTAQTTLFPVRATVAPHSVAHTR